MELRPELVMLGMMSSEKMDLEAFGKSETYAGIEQNRQLMSRYPKEDAAEVLAYWREKGVKKELHDLDPECPWMKWASYLPLSSEREPRRTYPLLFVLHGSGNPIYLAESYGYAEIAAREELITIIPEDETPENIERLLAYAREHYPVDWRRVYMVGYSLGGFMTSRHALRWPEKFAAVGVGGMLFANGHAGSHMQRGLLWPGEEITSEMVQRAAEYRIPVCNCCGEYEVLGLIPATQDEPQNGWVQHLSEEQQKQLQAMMPPRPRQPEPQPTPQAEERIDLSGKNKIQSINNWRIANGCAPVPEEEVRRAARDSADIVVEKLGFPFEKTTVELREGRSHFIGDCVTPEGRTVARFIGLAKSPHWPSQALCELTWEFISRFERDPETGVSIERNER